MARRQHQPQQPASTVDGRMALLAGPAAALADIVFDPTNFAEAVQQVSQDVQLVEQLRQQVQNQLSMLHGWGYTELPDLMKSMKVWQELFDAPGSPYASTSPGASLNQQYPLDPGSYAQTSDPAMQSMIAGWDKEERQELTENRTVQDDAYLQLQPTAQRIGAYVQRSIAQLQTLQSQELTDARGEVEQDAREQAKAAYAEQQRSDVRAGWDAPQGPSSSLVDAFPQGADLIVSSLFGLGGATMMHMLALDYGPDLFNQVANQYITAVNSGFGLIRSDVVRLLNVLIVLSVVWSAALGALSDDHAIAHLARKVVLIGLFASIVQNWQVLTDKLARSFMDLGLTAGGFDGADYYTQQPGNMPTWGTRQHSH